MTSDALLGCVQASAGYGGGDVLRDVSLSVGQSEVVAVLGHNGAGKTTLLRTLFGLLGLSAGRLFAFGGEVTSTAQRASLQGQTGYMPSDNSIFRGLSVEDNLALGGYSLRDRDAFESQRTLVYETLPVLYERRAQRGATLSGGQRRMLALGIAMMKRPRVLLLDEPSLGLSPPAVRSLMGVIAGLSAAHGIGVVIVEQSVPATLAIADRACFMRSGELILEERADDALARGQWWDLF